MTDSKTRDGLVQLPSKKLSLFASTKLLWSSLHHEKSLTSLVKNKEGKEFGDKPEEYFCHTCYTCHFEKSEYKKVNNQ